VQFLRPTGRICPTVNTVAVAKSWKSSGLKNLPGALHAQGDRDTLSSDRGGETRVALAGPDTAEQATDG
jgi:hypothetical protein